MKRTCVPRGAQVPSAGLGSGGTTVTTRGMSPIPMSFDNTLMLTGGPTTVCATSGTATGVSFSGVTVIVTAAAADRAPPEVGHGVLEAGRAVEVSVRLEPDDARSWIDGCDLPVGDQDRERHDRARPADDADG